MMNVKIYIIDINNMIRQYQSIDEQDEFYRL